MSDYSNHNRGAGTPSKHKAGFGSNGAAATATTANTNSSSSGWKTLRWILFGFGVGTAATALFQSVNMPRIRVELEFEDAPHLGGGIRKSSFVIGGGGGSGATTSTNTDDAVQVEVERQAIAQALLAQGKVADKKELLAETTNATTKVLEDDDNEFDFSDPGPPPALDKGEAFAACILIKDDNHWLIEWLAYHYHVMPLRYLIVAIDPASKTTPIPILKRWRDRKLMTISIWDDAMFMPKKINAKATSFDNNTELMMHRVRQNNFYFKCMRTFKQRNREWLMLIDTDEYIVTNYASGLYYNLTKQIPITKPGNVLKFIKHHHQLTGENHTCSYMPRYMFGAKDTPADILHRHMPAGWNGSHFLTQRFQYRNPRRMHNGKNLINIRKLPQIKTYTSVHHVSSYCPDPDKMRTVNHVKKSLVRIHHYLGSEEQYFFRSDPRQPKETNATKSPTYAPGTNKTWTKAAYFTRGKGRYQSLNRGANYPDQGARAWVRGFIKDVGLDMAKTLLRGVGQVGYEGEEDEIKDHMDSITAPPGISPLAGGAAAAASDAEADQNEQQQQPQAAEEEPAAEPENDNEPEKDNAPEAPDEQEEQPPPPAEEEEGGGEERPEEEEEKEETQEGEEGEEE